MELPLSLQLVAAVVFGLVIGSFLNVVILRLPRKMYRELEESCAELREEQYEPAPNRWFGLDYLITPASSCPKCGHGIRAWENIPILSYLMLRGRCSSCATPIGIRYPIIEAVTGVLTAFTVWQFGATLEGLAICVLMWGLIALTVIDIDEKLLPDEITLPLLWLGLLVNLPGTFASLSDAVVGAAAGYGILWFIFQLFRLLTGKEGMGYGDFKLFALFGAWLGWQMLGQILLVSTLVGAIVGIAMILLLGRDRQVPIPFGPYLATAGAIAVFYGDSINKTYLQIAGLT